MDEVRITKRLKFIEQALEIRETPADEADSVAYVARVLAQVTMPHSKTDATHFERTNGEVSISMVALSKVGLPFGTYPRLAMSWMATEAKRTNSPRLELGNSLSGYMRQLAIVPHGGRWGTITRLRDQMNRLLTTAMSWTTYEKNGKRLHNVVPVREARFWWDPAKPDQSNLWQSEIRLDDEFFKALVHRPVPVDIRALKVLAHERSPLALDIYTWLTYRMSYLEKPTVVPWASLQAQFGGDFGRTRDFKAKFLERLTLVLQLYPVRVRPNEDRRRPGLILEPSPTHVLKR